MKKIALMLSTACLLVLAGCNTGPTTAQRENMIKPNENYNFFGIVSSEQGTFKQPSKNSLHVTSDEVTTRDNYSGDSVSLLWGLITLRDY